MALKDIQARLRTFSLDNEVESIINADPSAITKLNTKQLSFGYSSDGEQLGLYRSQEYAEYKHHLNPYAGYGVVDARLTGDFYRDFIAEAKAGKLHIYSRDVKAAKLERQYGKDRLYGLDGESIIDYRRETLKPELNQRIRQKVLI